MGDLIIIVILLCIISSIIIYLYKAKKGKTCIGCPYGGQCGSRQEGGCAKHEKEDTE